jgi:hypothetical protein
MKTAFNYILFLIFVILLVYAMYWKTINDKTKIETNNLEINSTTQSSPTAISESGDTLKVPVAKIFNNKSQSNSKASARKLPLNVVNTSNRILEAPKRNVSASKDLNKRESNNCIICQRFKSEIAEEIDIVSKKKLQEKLAIHKKEAKN